MLDRLQGFLEGGVLRLAVTSVKCLDFPLVSDVLTMKEPGYTKVKL